MRPPVSQPNLTADNAPSMGREVSAELSEPVETGRAPDPIPFTIMAKHEGHLTKVISLDETGKGIIKDGSFCRMSRGTARRMEASSLSEAAGIIQNLARNEAITLGVFADNAPKAEIASKTMVREGLRTRTKGGPEGFIFQPGRPALLLIDIDLDGQLEGYDGTVESGWNWLTTLCPWLKGVGYIGRPSTSSGIFLDDHRLDNPRKAGLHIYLVVQNGEEVPVILQRIDDELWLKRSGHIKISASGQRLFRTPVDATVGSPERLVFEAPPILTDRLTQAARYFGVIEGKQLGRADIPPLGAFTRFELAEIRRDAYEAAAADAKKQREAWKAERLRLSIDQYVRQGLTEAEARTRAREDMASWERAILPGSIILTLEGIDADGYQERTVSVDALYENAAEWDGCYCRDPDEPQKGQQKARVKLDAAGWLFAHSWVGGGRIYLLRPSLQGVLGRIGRWASLPREQQTFLLRDCGRIDVDEAGLLPVYDALAAAGVRRAEAKRVIASVRKEAREVVTRHEQQAETAALGEPRPVDQRATQAEIAQDARSALTGSGVAPVFDRDELHVFDGGMWQVLSKETLSTWIGLSYRHCDVVKRTPDCKAVLSALRYACAKPGFFDDTRPGVAVGNDFWTLSSEGVLRKEELKHSHGARFRLPFEPDLSGVEPPMLGDLFSMVFEPNDRNDLAFSVGALMGCAILGLGHVFKEAGFLIGAGDTGKSTLGALLSMFLPRVAVAAVPLGQMNKEYSLAQLAKARLNLPGEEAADAVIPAAALKQITGGDRISARWPYGQPFSFVSRALQLFTANKMPPLREHELQVYRRIVFIPFTREIPPEKRIGKTEIAARKIFEAEGPLILGWAMTCAAKAVAAETMQTRATLEASKVWRKTEDTVLDAFLGSDSCFPTTGNKDDRIPAAAAFLTYQRHAQDAGRKPLGRNHFYDRIKSSQDLKAVGVTIVEDRKGQKFITGVRALSGQMQGKVEQLLAVVPKAG
jgi:P4 family phage/plasmid primase-like protien